MTDALEPLVVVIDIAAPPSRVWRALTTPDEIAKWWGAGDVAPEVGHHFALDMGAFGSQPCEVVDVDSERRFRFRFADHWELDWMLEPVDGGSSTRLTLIHSGFDASDPMDGFAHVHMGQGWRDSVLPALRELAEAD